jgi:hypothetical protein
MLRRDPTVLFESPSRILAILSSHRGGMDRFLLPDAGDVIKFL